jgi:hypothetical protein
MIEVLKQMVDALEWCYGGEPINTAEAIQAGKQAIAELESLEPRNVRERWNVELDGNDLLVCFNDHEKGNKCQYERYSPQRTWVNLTNEEIEEIKLKAGSNVFSAIMFTNDRLEEKNT